MRLLLLVLLTGSFPAAATATTYRDADLRFAVTLPPGWNEASPSVLARQCGPTAPTVDPSGRRCLTVFHASQGEQLALPFVLLAYFEWPNETLESLAEIAAELANRPSPEPRSELVPSMVFGEATVDRGIHAILLQTRAEIEGVGLSRGMTVLRPARSVTLQLVFFAPERQFDEHWSAFREALTSLRFEAAHEYISSTQYPPGQELSGFVGLLVAVLILGTVGLFVAFLYRLRADA